MQFKLVVSGTVDIGPDDDGIRRLLKGEEGNYSERVEVAFQELQESALGELEVTLTAK